MKYSFYIWTMTMLFFGCGPYSTQTENSLSFEKILFHTTGSPWDCPTYHLEVDSNKQIKLFAERVYNSGENFSFKLDTSKIGYFKGVVDDSTFTLLYKELQGIGLDTLEFEAIYCCDASIITIIVYYDGKRKYLQSMSPPDHAINLVILLYDICKDSSLIRSKQNFYIEH